ncbi:phosphocholine cytidylyltransferase family protein [Polaribacter sp. PL03]|uniref:phosphocholine cytidylyltransferase family protein n=1 Tax=Polaribacter sp. PL03 TaxID=3088353 RepID=UPI0029CAE29E|nr:phosphocholine cytidylyltransferase family protein [Polaribacter sp. PL03]MDX6746977.1 phosphocholine cytidylyltransferase family protein [Polaribacter sp. PL03]
MNINLEKNSDGNRITTALLLAAGTGSRLFPITKDAPKCLTLVSEKSILERLVINLQKQGFKRLVIVTGYKKECIVDFIESKTEGLTVEYVHNPLYKTTNNIYSLWMARNIINEPFVLLESDLVLETSLLNKMVYPDRMAVAKMQPWLNGTTVAVNNLNVVTKFQAGTTEEYTDVRYKTVNIYSFSLSTWNEVTKKLNQYISEGSVNCYYEVVFSKMVEEKSLILEAVSFDEKPWYEIDTINDLAEAEKLFPLEVSKEIKYAVTQ